MHECSVYMVEANAIAIQNWNYTVFHISTYWVIILNNYNCNSTGYMLCCVVLVFIVVSELHVAILLCIHCTHISSVWAVSITVQQVHKRDWHDDSNTMSRICNFSWQISYLNEYCCIWKRWLARKHTHINTRIQDWFDLKWNLTLNHVPLEYTGWNS